MIKTQRSGRGGIEAQTTGTGRTLTENQIHNLLRNERRRAVLRFIAASPERTVAVRDLAERIAAEETETDPPPRNTRQSVYVSLIQTHLPKLADVGVVEYDEQAKTATDTPLMDQLAPYTETLTQTTAPEQTTANADHEESLLVPALATVAGGWLFSAGATLNAPVIGKTTPLVWSLCGIVGMVALLVYDRR